MAGSTISGTITTGVTLGSGGYLSPLTITPTGRVDDAGFHNPLGLVALYVPSGTYATIANYGTVAGSGTLGVGVFFAGSGSLLNHGAISGHLGGTGIALGAAAALTNFAGATITGGDGSSNGDGGAGVVLDGGLLNNSGAIVGGRDDNQIFGFGPTGVQGSGSIVNNGHITGGYDVYMGGDGVNLTGPANLVNHGIISGAYSQIAPGGFGIILGVGDNVINTGTIAGGAGHYDGATGAEINGGTVFNSGLIRGGGGIYPGLGVMLDGGTLINAGTISGTSADAVYFGITAATLVVEPGAVFMGQVIASTAAHDVLIAAGTATTPLAGIGTEFRNFSSIEFAPHAQGTIEGNVSGLAHGQTISGFQHHDTIVLDGFTATSGTYAAGAGVELSDGARTVTLDITGAFNPNELRGSSSDAGTTISLADTAPITLGTDLSSFTFVATTQMKAEQHNLVSAWLHPIDFSPATSFQASVETKPPSGPPAAAGLLPNPFGGTEVAGLLAHQIPWLHAG